MDIDGITVIERVYRQALKANPKSIIIATDNQTIFDLATHFGAHVLMTSENHSTGTDRAAEVVKAQAFAADDIIVNVQGDEPFIDPALIVQVSQSLAESDAPMATLCWPVDDVEQLTNPNVVKVVRDCNNNALYFSRSMIPANRDQSTSMKHVFRHIGLYAYRAGFLLDVVSWPVCELEQIEALEQLRVLWRGQKIRVDQACLQPLQDINTAEDLERARRLVVP